MTAGTAIWRRAGSRHALLCLLLCAPLSCGGGGEAGGEANGGGASGHDGEPGGARANRLAQEKSPYLLQHAYNPVDWYPWGDEALAKARSENKPIFLSIGYSTCHWCHVMEHESFEDEEVAGILNEHFVPIKVDREERPDLDNIYMGALHAMGNRGGWPLTVVLTPGGEAFFGGTYFPKDDRGQRPGLITILNGITQMWENEPARAQNAATQITSRLRLQAKQMVADASAASLDSGLLDLAFEEIGQGYDPVYGGFGSGTKFPTPHKLNFLLRYAARTGNERAIELVRGTLDAMAAGGIHDHLGGGFHRYSTERRWLVPHFEKMLYDQAGLCLAYSNAWLVTGDSTYARVVRDIAGYVLEYLLDPEGGFHSAEDADSEGEEGTFYVWSAAEIDEILGSERGPMFRQAYGVTEPGNWEGKNIINRVGKTPLTDGFEEERFLLLAERDRRPRPHLDDKIIVSWNGYMIEALAVAARALDEPEYAAAAARAAAFIEDNLWRDGRLLRHHRDGAADVTGYLDDYAYLGRGLLALYETTFETRYLERSLHLARELQRLFANPEGGFAYTGSDAEEPLVPIVDLYDGALPSGNSVAATFMLRLGHLLADQQMEDRGREVVGTFLNHVASQPSAYLEMLSGLDFAIGPMTEIVIAGGRSDPTVTSMWEAVWGRYLPNTVTAFSPDGRDEALIGLIPYLEAQRSIDAKPTAFVCRDYACRLPVHTTGELIGQLNDD